MRISSVFKHLFLSLRGKLALSFLIVVLAAGLVSTISGIRFFGHTVIGQAQNKVKHDLASAWMVYNEKLDHVRTVILLTSKRFFIGDALASGRDGLLRRELERMRKEYHLDVLTLTDKMGKVVVRARSPYNIGDDQSNDDLVSRALKREVVASTQIVAVERLRQEGDGLERQAYFAFIPTPKAKPRPEKEETSGMMLKAAVPVVDENGDLLGVLYGGVLLNRSYEIVDRIKEVVYKGEKYKGKEIGTATIFQWDFRISTNVRREDGLRAIGTRVSSEVYDAVLENARPWIDRAFVVNNWYITAYEPIKDIRDKVIGMLYVGILEEPYLDARRNVMWTAIKFTLLGIGLVLVIAYFLGRGITRPIMDLVHATEEVSRGRLPRRVEIKSRDEIRTLADSFNRMCVDLKRTLEEKDAAYERLKDLNLRYLELLGFATHELMQPLGVLKGYLVMMGDSSPEGLTSEQREQAASAMLRNVNMLINMSRKYLHLSKIESGELEVNRNRIRIYEEVLQPVVEDEKPQMAVRNMAFRIENEEGFRQIEVEADPTLMRIVYSNLITNALKYGRRGGKISCGFKDAGGYWRFNVWNEGQGIPQDKLEAVFEKFVRLGGEIRHQRGTGLGLFNTKEIIQKHAGWIWAESVEGKWTNFVFTLPKEQGSRGAEEQGRPASAPPSAGGKDGGG